MPGKIIDIESHDRPFQMILQRTIRMVPDRDRADTSLRRLIAFRLKLDGESATHAYLVGQIREVIRCGYTGRLYNFLKDDLARNACRPREANSDPPDVA